MKTCTRCLNTNLTRVQGIGKRARRVEGRVANQGRGCDQRKKGKVQGKGDFMVLDELKTFWAGYYFVN